MTPRTYASPEAFKQALEQRRRSSAKTGAELARKRQLLVLNPPHGSWRVRDWPLILTWRGTRRGIWVPIEVRVA